MIQSGIISEEDKSNKLSKIDKIIVIILSILLIASLILAIVFFFIQVAYPIFNNFSGTLQAAIFGLIVLFLSPKYENYQPKYLIIGIFLFNSLILAYSISLIVTYIIVQSYFSAFCFLCCLFPSTYHLIRYFKHFRHQKKDRHDKKLLSQQTEEDLQFQLQTRQSKSKKCCKICVMILACFILLFGIFLMISGILMAKSYNQYSAYGKIINIPKIENSSALLKFHIYCTGNITNQKGPLLIFQHGAGSNLMAFSHIQRILRQNNVASCSYDRLGYGRSQNSPQVNQDPKIKALRLNSLMQEAIKLFYGQKYLNTEIVLLGWSAGVEIIQNYYYFYPQKVKALVYIDGYPDYLALMAISQKAQSYQPRPFFIVLQLNLLRYLQPYVSLFLSPSIVFQDKQLEQYYNAYSMTGYFWNSQYIDYTNSFDLTEQFTKRGNQKKASKPYPQSKIDLNWPDIPVPLLILPAMNTYNGEYNSVMIYKVQCEKYLLKCTNQLKRIVPIEGQHGYIMQSGTKIAGEQILKFVEEINSNGIEVESELN